MLFNRAASIKFSARSELAEGQFENTVWFDRLTMSA
jgi:hypothetical protein